MADLGTPFKVPRNLSRSSISECHQHALLLHRTISNRKSFNGSRDHGCNSRSHIKMRINVCGQIFVTYRCILQNFPNTLLGDRNQMKRYWDPDRREYYFDTNQRTFEAIMQFYQTGYLLRPIEVPLHTFIEQLELFKMDQDTMEKFYKQEGLPQPFKTMEKASSIRGHMWNLFEFPAHSAASRCVSIVSILCVLLSVLLMCMETVPQWSVPMCKTYKSLDLMGNVHAKLVPNSESPFFLLDNVIVVWFTIELMLRLFSCPDRKHFLTQVINILDGLALLPHYILLMSLMVTNDCWFMSAGAFLTSMRIMRLVRIAKITRYNTSLQLVIHAFRESYHYLGACFYMIFSIILVLAFIMYVVEEDQKVTPFTSIAEALWWAVASMTTVGYGDIVPTTASGRAIGGVCILVGFIMLSLPCAIIVTNYHRYYVTCRGIMDHSFRRR